MGYDLGRAALACLSVLTVVFAASQFPAAGVGDYPGGIGGDVSNVGETAPAAGDGGGEVPGGTPSGSDGESGDCPGPSSEQCPDDGGESGPDDGGTTPTEGQSGPNESTETATETATPTETPTETVDPDVGEEDDEIVGAVTFLLFGVPVALFALLTGGMATGVVAFTAGEGGRVVMRVAGTEIDLGGGLQRLSQASMGVVLGLSSSSARLVRGLGDAVGGLAGSVSLLGGGAGRALASLPAAMGRGLVGAGRGLGGALAAVPSGFGSVLSGLGSFGLGWGGSAPDEDARRLGDATPATGGGDGDDDRRPPPQSVEEAWERFVELVPVRDSRARTPGEYARAAVGRGLPADPVGQLTRTFREVRYGERPADEERFERARAAWSRIRSHAAEEDDT